MKDKHLTDKEIFSIIIEPDTAERKAYRHLKKCALCQKRFNKIKAFTGAFHEHVVQNDINWALERQKVIATLSEQGRTSFIKWKWATAVAFSCLILVSVFLFKQFYNNNEILISERDLLQEIQVVTDFKDNAEFSQSILYLSGYEPEASHSFFNLFLPIEEDYNEKEDVTDDIFGITSFKRRVHA